MISHDLVYDIMKIYIHVYTYVTNFLFDLSPLFSQIIRLFSHHWNGIINVLLLSVNLGDIDFLKDVFWNVLMQFNFSVSLALFW